MEGESKTEIVDNETKLTKENERLQRSEKDDDKLEIPDHGNGMSMVPNDDSSSSTRVPSKEVLTSISQDENLQEETPNWEGLKSRIIAMNNCISFVCLYTEYGE